MNAASKSSGLVQAGEIPLLKAMVKEAMPLSQTTNRILDAAVEVRQEPDAYEIAYLARELVQCTLPHTNPGDVPAWSRTNGNLT